MSVHSPGPRGRRARWRTQRDLRRIERQLDRCAGCCGAVCCRGICRRRPAGRSTRGVVGSTGRGGLFAIVIVRAGECRSLPAASTTEKVSSRSPSGCCLVSTMSSTSAALAQGTGRVKSQVNFVSPAAVGESEVGRARTVACPDAGERRTRVGGPLRARRAARAAGLDAGTSARASSTGNSPDMQSRSGDVRQAHWGLATGKTRGCGASLAPSPRACSQLLLTLRLPPRTCERRAAPCPNDESPALAGLS